VLEAPIPRLSEVLINCPAKLEDVVSRCIRRDPADRFYSIVALGRAVEGVRSSIAAPQAEVARWSPAPGALIPATNWILQEKIGQGGAGEVWIGEHANLGESRVFKFCESEEKMRTLKREMTLFRLLKERVGRNPHFITLHEVSLDVPPYYLMMDHVGAVELETWCAQQVGGVSGLPEKTRLEIIIQAAEALQAAHDAGILHRDVKPSNLLISNTPCGLHVYVADFGIGQLVAEEVVRGGTRLGFTETFFGVGNASLAGTVLYLAPEILEGQAATIRADIYSLGVVSWQLITGNLKAALDPLEWFAGISDPLLREDLSRCLSGNPEKRWTSAGEFSRSLKALPERRQAEIRRQEELRQAERRAYVRGAVRIGAVAVCLILIVTSLAWAAWTSSRVAQRARLASAKALTRTGLRELQALLDLKSGQARTRLETELKTLGVRGSGLEAEFRSTASAILALPSFEEMGANVFGIGSQCFFSAKGERLITTVDGTGEIAVLDLAVAPPVTKKLRTSASLTNLQVNSIGRVAGGIEPAGGLTLWYGSGLLKKRTISGPIFNGCFALAPSPLGRARKTPVAVARPVGAIDVFLAEDEADFPLRLFRRAGPNLSAFPESSASTMVQFSPALEGILAVAGPDSGNVLFWKLIDRDKAPLQGEIAGALWHPDRITALQWSSVDDGIATGSRDGILRVWRFAVTETRPQSEPLYSIDYGEGIAGIGWSPDGNVLAVLLDSGRIECVWAKGPRKAPLARISFPGARFVTFATGNVLAAGDGKTIRFWGGPQIFAERGASEGLVEVAFHPKGSLTLTARDRIELLNPATLASTGGFRNDSVHPAFWNGPELLFEARSGWKKSTPMETEGWLVLPAAPTSIPGIRLAVGSPRGIRMATWDGKLVRSNYLGKEEGFPAELSEEPQVLAISDEEPIIVKKGSDGRLVARNHLDGTETILAETRTGSLSCAFGSGIMAFRTANEVVFVDPKTWRTATAALEAPVSTPAPLAFSPDGSQLVISAVDQSLLLATLPPRERRWEQEGKQLRDVFKDALPLRAPLLRRISSLVWNASSSRFACGSVDGFAQTWDVSLLRRQLRLLHLDEGTTDNATPGEELVLPIHLSN
jgi:WD40 repeat protein